MPDFDLKGVPHRLLPPSYPHRTAPALPPPRARRALVPDKRTRGARERTSVDPGLATARRQSRRGSATSSSRSPYRSPICIFETTSPASHMMVTLAPMSLRSVSLENQV